MLADFTPYLYNNYQTIDEHNSNNEPMATHFHVDGNILTCHYCEREQDISHVELV